MITIYATANCDEPMRVQVSQKVDSPRGFGSFKQDINGGAYVVRAVICSADLQHNSRLQPRNCSVDYPGKGLPLQRLWLAEHRVEGAHTLNRWREGQARHEVASSIKYFGFAQNVCLASRLNQFDTVLNEISFGFNGGDGDCRQRRRARGFRQT